MAINSASSVLTQRIDFCAANKDYSCMLHNHSCGLCFILSGVDEDTQISNSSLNYSTNFVC